MDFTFSAEQELLRDGLSKFLAGRYDLKTSRAAAKSGPGWQPDIWQSFAEELGILGAALPEDAGGIGGGPVEVMLIAEALGHALVIEPYVDTAVVAAGLLLRSGSATAGPVLAEIASGTAVVALAAAEADSGDRWQDVQTTASRDGDDWVLRGDKIMVVNAPLATHLLVTAQTPGGISLFLVDISESRDGLVMHSYRTVDDRRAADLELRDVRLPGDALLGAEGEAWPSIAQARDEGAAAVCAEAVGNMRKALADTVEYAKQRQQFGQPIGRFQVIQHRLVDAYARAEAAQSALYRALLRPGAPPAAVKGFIADAAQWVGQQAVQLHGGMGMTDELAIGHGLKRIVLLGKLFGDAAGGIAAYGREAA